ncbi:MAG: hypothetical protein KID00_01690 [Clostridium argentinense]|uniref:DUF8091 domain-containing protein n=1 Tax=Clostridium faecium TaxID=2762223 RepID=A0ABR8YNV9_9CLOT|nr:MULTISPECIES: hypothetical protein [Clostridium]MBD8045930.1 hypothetical protein [Clostridium faecium]MBS5822569.1 hypothetical protein [Clostridium argentinense]MDU1348008.1 hypothetical protein [Clostridium argentinense]
MKIHMESFEINHKNIETKGIGLQKEKSLHKSLKNIYCGKDGRMEVMVEGYIIDAVKDNVLYEIQSKNFYNIQNKLKDLVVNNKVVLVHPIAAEKTIILLNEDGQVVSKRKSPKKGKIIDCFDEIMSISHIALDKNLEIEILLTKEEELRIKDGKGSFRRKGISLGDKILVDIVDKYTFKNKEDYYAFLPEDLSPKFTNKDLSSVLGLPVNKIRKMTYTLKKMGLIKETGKRGRELLFEKEME